MGCPCDIAGDGEQALAMEKTKKYRLIIMEFQMPKMDGYQATREIRKWEGERKKIPIVAHSTLAFESDKIKCRERGKDDFLAKPITKSQILMMVKKWIEKKEE